MQYGQSSASPGQWLIDDVARERAEFELRQVSPKPFSPTTAARDAAHVQAGVGLPGPESVLVVRNRDHPLTGYTAAARRAPISLQSGEDGLTPFAICSLG
jgi:hypothetical protein